MLRANTNYSNEDTDISPISFIAGMNPRSTFSLTIYFTQESINDTFQDGYSHSLLQTVKQIAREDGGGQDILMITIVKN